MATTDRLVTMTPETYFADPCDQPSLSASIATELLARSPRHAFLMHPKLGGIRKPATKAMDKGSLIDALLLGKGKGIVAVDAEDWRTKAAREERDAAHAAGKVPVLQADLDGAVSDADALRQRIADFGIALNGESQRVALWWEMAETGAGVECRGMLDHWVQPIATIYDLKVCRSAHPDAIARHMLDYGCDIQAAAYRHAMGAIFPELAGRIDFIFLFCEVEPVPMVTPIRPDGSMRELGERKWQRAVNLWARCIERNEWPGYTSSIITIAAPPWALSREFDTNFEEAV